MRETFVECGSYSEISDIWSHEYELKIGGVHIGGLVH